MLCEILLTQRVTDAFIEKLNVVDLAHERKLYQIKQWLYQQNGSDNWHRDIEAISEFGVTRGRVFFFSERAAGYRYLSAATVPPADEFVRWLSGMESDLIAVYRKLNCKHLK